MATFRDIFQKENVEGIFLAEPKNPKDVQNREKSKNSKNTIYVFSHKLIKIVVSRSV
jgi:hypothetical protein